MEQRVIVLRGAPASGKSSLAKSYRDFQQKVAWLKVDNFKDFFSDDSSQALDYVNGAAVATLEYLLKQGFSIVMEGVFQNTQAIDDVRKIADSNKVPVRIFELKVSLNTLLNRDALREGVPEGLRKPLGRDLITELFNTLQNNPYPEAIELDTEKNTVEDCKKIIDSHF